VTREARELELAKIRGKLGKFAREALVKLLRKVRKTTTKFPETVISDLLQINSEQRQKIIRQFLNNKLIKPVEVPKKYKRKTPPLFVKVGGKKWEIDRYERKWMQLTARGLSLAKYIKEVGGATKSGLTSGAMGPKPVTGDKGRKILLFPNEPEPVTPPERRFATKREVVYYTVKVEKSGKGYAVKFGIKGVPVDVKRYIRNYLNSLFSWKGYNVVVHLDRNEVFVPAGKSEADEIAKEVKDWIGILLDNYGCRRKYVSPSKWSQIKRVRVV